MLHRLWLSLVGLSLILRVAAASDACYGGDAVLAKEAITLSRGQYAYGWTAPFGGQLPLKKPAAAALKVAVPEDACQIPDHDESEFEGSIIVAERGNCTFAQKAIYAQTLRASVLLVYNTEPGCLNMGVNASVPASAVWIPVVGISRQVGERLTVSAAAGRRFVCWAPKTPVLDPAAGLVWLLAVGTVAAASIWAGHDYSSGRQCLPDGSPTHRRRPSATQVEETVEVQMVTGAGAVAFIAIASTMLIFLYFFLDRLFALILMLLFSLASLQALGVLFASLIGAAVPELRSRHIDFGCGIGKLALHSCLSIFPAVAWIAAWFWLDPDTWGWIFQDGMGVALMLLVMRQFMLPDLKVACLLLPLCFLYDVFWVFIQPLLTDGPSVMVKVATGGSSHRAMPMLLRVPSLLGPPYSTSILGYGDVVLPGMLLVFARTWDMAFLKRPAVSYFWPLLCGYAVGLLLTFAALVLRVGGSQGQPALLYLIPCTLGLCLGLAWHRRELLPMWRGIGAEFKRLGSPEAPDFEPEFAPLASGESAVAGSSSSEASQRGSSA